LRASSGVVILARKADVTQILSAIEAGDRQAAAELLPLVYDELRKLAAQRLAQEKPGQTLQPTALVHEAYLRLVGSNPEQPWNGRGHFFAAAAEAMRRILVDAARRRTALKRGGAGARLPTDPDALAAPDSDEHILSVHEALQHLERADPDAARHVNWRFSGGLPADEAAGALGMSVRAAHDLWVYARAWLRRHLPAE
jgi:RNA polymerase sigma factor (TIGR02999 family)